jgi:hypothetical protein
MPTTVADMTEAPPSPGLAARYYTDPRIRGDVDPHLDGSA